MSDHNSCKYWNYDHHPDRAVGLPQRCRTLTDAIITSRAERAAAGFDTRADHAFMFRGMTPAICPCIIGNYRGSADCPDLVLCPVGIKDNKLVGLAPLLVPAAMKVLVDDCERFMTRYYGWIAGGGRNVGTYDRLRFFADGAANMITRFLTIHPYIDGNGHCARLMVFKMLAWAEFSPKNWDIDAKLPIYDELNLYRKGERGPLIRTLTRHFCDSM